MKARSQAIEVEEEEGRPTCLTWRRRQPVREVLDSWVVQGKWWGKEERRVYFRVRTDSAVLEIYRGKTGWRLARTVD